MKRSKMILLLTVLLFNVCFLFTKKVEAYQIYYNSVVTRSNPEIRKYLTRINGESYMTYCLDPGRQRASQSTSITSLDPSIYAVNTPMYKFALASQYVYQLMKDNGYTTISDAGYAAGNTAFRLIARAFYDGGLVYSGLKSAYNAYNNMGAGLRRINGIQNGIDIASAAISFANQYGGTAYSDIVDAGLIHSVTWTTVRSEIVQISGSTNYQLTVEITPSDSNIYSVDYSRFSIGFLNTTAPIVSQSASQGSGNNAVITVVFNGATWDQQDLAAYVDTYYCDPNDASSMLYLLNTTKDKQRFIVVLPGTVGTCTSGNASPYGGHRSRINTGDGGNNICSCDTSTGNYTYTDKDGNKTTWAGTESRPSSVPSNVFCPNTCTKKVTCDKVDNKYYCKDGEVCTEEEYKKECTHDCEKSSDSSTGYYCPTDDGKGKECPEIEYQLVCENDGVNCAPEISLPSNCNNLNSYEDGDLNSTVNGTVSDINTTVSSCNSDVNQVKKCVLGKSDVAGNSYEATNELTENIYCKVYCKEKYDFTLPTAQITTSGRYFTLETTVTGERDCYTASASSSQQPIGYNSEGQNQFQLDLKAAQKEVIDKYNDYAKWKAAAATDAEPHDLEAKCEDDDEPVVTDPQNEANYDVGSYEVVFCDDDVVDGSTCSDTATQYTKSWSWYEYDYNGNRKLNKSEESYSSGSCGDCCCTEGDNPDSCSEYDKETGKCKDTYHVEDRDDALAALKIALNNLNKIIAQYNSCTGVITNGTMTDISDIVTADSTSASSWANDMEFDPNVEYWYNQDYMNVLSGVFVETSSKAEVTNNMFCSGNVTDQYVCLSGETSTMSTPLTGVVTCDDDGCAKKNFYISNAKWIRKTKINETTFASDSNFSTYTQYGTIKADWASKTDYLLTNLPEGSFPISLITKTGVFPFTFKFSNIGQYNDSSKLGRLIGDSNSVIVTNATLPDSVKCNADSESDASVDGGYVCHYLNNCSGDNCDFSCDPDDPNDCTFNVCTDGICKVTCENCIFDGESSTYSYRSVSLNNLFPNGLTDRGYNWSSVKGEVTKKEIESAGESIYEEAQYSYTLTPSNMKQIRTYNNLAGSFTNSTVPSDYAGSNNVKSEAIYCETVTIGGTSYKINCRSSFLDLIDVSGNKLATNVYRITSDKVLGTAAFELWTQSDLGDGIGPSWRLKGSGVS